MFVQANSALAGYKSISHEAMKDPNSWEAVVLSAPAGCERGSTAAILTAAASLVQFDTLARPSEVLAMDPSWVFKAKGNDGQTQTAVTFFPSSQAGKDKNQQQDDTIVAGEVCVEVEWLPQLLLQLLKRKSGGRFFPLSLAQYESEFKSNAESAGLKRFNMTPHGNRHGGASLMSLANRDSVMIQTRGRWAATKSVLRYKKHGRYLRVKAALTADELACVPSALENVRLALTRFYGVRLTPSSRSHRPLALKTVKGGRAEAAVSARTKPSAPRASKSVLPLKRHGAPAAGAVTAPSAKKRRHRQAAPKPAAPKKREKFNAAELELQVSQLTAEWRRKLKQNKF